MDTKGLVNLYAKAHNLMRNIDGLQPQEAFDELLKFLFLKEANEIAGASVPVTAMLGKDGGYMEDAKAIATNIRSQFAQHLQKINGWSKHIWTDRKFQLSDNALYSINKLFEATNIRSIPFDIRSAALKEFMPPEVRKGLGIYLTPDNVVRAVVNAVRPTPNQRVLDPACGAATFLIETLKTWHGEVSSNHSVWGVDKNPRMMLLAELNLNDNDQVTFHHKIADSLFDFPKTHSASDEYAPNSFDVVLTNPPFGVYLDRRNHDLARYATCKDESGDMVARQQSELVFIEQCLRLLKPGGTLAIVLPKSVITNVLERVSNARKAIERIGYVYGLMELPPETFATTGTQSSTVVLFMRKYMENENNHETVNIAYLPIQNVGFDSTGRVREGEQLTQGIADFRSVLKSQHSVGLCQLLTSVQKNASLSSLQSLLTEPSESGVTLGDITELVSTGRTPSRASYTVAGLFILKVGNLTGQGIDWSARDRNFIKPDEITKRQKSGLLLRAGDIVLTSSAHSVVYIAKKVDVVSQIPLWLDGKASAVGEVMIVRPNMKKVNPYVLLAYLRSPSTLLKIQKMVRGQTAHLHPTDLKSLPIPETVVKPSNIVKRLAESMRLEAELAERLSELAHSHETLLEEAFCSQ